MWHLWRFCIWSGNQNLPESDTNLLCRVVYFSFLFLSVGSISIRIWHRIRYLGFTATWPGSGFDEIWLVDSVQDFNPNPKWREKNSRLNKVGLGLKEMQSPESMKNCHKCHIFLCILCNNIFPFSENISCSKSFCMYFCNMKYYNEKKRNDFPRI